MTDTTVPITTKKDWTSDQEVRWCPGCGDYSILMAMQMLMPDLGVRRENTVFVHGSPRLTDSKTQVYLDIEGLPDNESYYLLGALIVTEGQEAFHSFWASDALPGSLTSTSRSFATSRRRRSRFGLMKTSAR